MNEKIFKIAILDCTKTIYNEILSKQMSLGGIERCVVSLSRALADKGHEVRVFAHENAVSEYQNIHWSSKNKPTNFKADIVIACNDPKLFDNYAQYSGHTSFKPYVWHHNPVSFWKTVRKGRLIPLLKWRPVNIFLGTYHLRNYPAFLPSRQNVIIHHGVEDTVLNFQTKKEAPPPYAAFISQPYRGLDNLITLWKEHVYPVLPSAKLFIYGTVSNPAHDLERFGIVVEGRFPREELLNRLASTRATLIPGHEDETFCLSAIESLCLGIPVISFGIGALSERIITGEDGFITKSNEDFARKTLQLLQDDTLWTKMSLKASEKKAKSSWDDKVTEWEDLFRIS